MPPAPRAESRSLAAAAGVRGAGAAFTPASLSRAALRISASNVRRGGRSSIEASLPKLPHADALAGCTDDGGVLPKPERGMPLERRHAAEQAAGMHEGRHAPFDRLLDIGTGLVDERADVVQDRRANGAAHSL